MIARQKKQIEGKKIKKIEYGKKSGFFSNYIPKEFYVCSDRGLSFSGS
jgi:hypothetical protein